MSLIEKVASGGELLNAWLSIKHRPQSKGIDSITIAEFADDLHVNLRNLGKQVRSGSYEFQLLRGHAVDKGNGSIRPLRIAAVGDRVVQKSILQNIQPRLEKRFDINNAVSFAFTKGRTVTNALKRVRDLYLAGYKWVYSGDIKTFFESIPPNQLFDDYIYPAIRDRTLDRLILGALNTEIDNLDQMTIAGWETEFLHSDVGIPQGCILSPLFANLYLTEFDQAMIRSEFELVRYADDFLVMCLTEEDAFSAHDLAHEILENKLKLKLHEVGGGKSSIGRFNTQSFLGFRFQGKQLYPGAKATAKMAKLLKDFGAHPPRETLLENLNYIRDKTNFWGATYFYAEIDDTIYDHLDENLAGGVAQIIQAQGFEPKTPPFTSAGLPGIGVPTLRERVHVFRVRKKKLMMEFYDTTAEFANSATAGGQVCSAGSGPFKNLAIPF